MFFHVIFVFFTSYFACILRHISRVFCVYFLRFFTCFCVYFVCFCVYFLCVFYSIIYSYSFLKIYGFLKEPFFIFSSFFTLIILLVFQFLYSKIFPIWKPFMSIIPTILFIFWCNSPFFMTYLYFLKNLTFLKPPLF